MIHFVGIGINLCSMKELAGSEAKSKLNSFCELNKLVETGQDGEKNYFKNMV